MSRCHDVTWQIVDIILYLLMVSMSTVVWWCGGVVVWLVNFLQWLHSPQSSVGWMLCVGAVHWSQSGWGWAGLSGLPLHSNSLRIEPVQPCNHHHHHHYHYLRKMLTLLMEYLFTCYEVLKIKLGNISGSQNFLRVVTFSLLVRNATPTWIL